MKRRMNLDHIGPIQKIEYDIEEWYADGIEGEVSGSGGFVEMEEDWEVLHEQVHAGEGGGADAQAEEDGDVVIDW